MDEVDRLILQALQEDGRTPFTQIAKIAGVSETTIRSRYRSLVEEGVVHTVSIVDPFALDFNAPAMIGISAEPGKVEQIAKAISELPEVSYLVMTLGPHDLLVEVYCRNLQHLTQLVTQRIQLIPGVRETETRVVAKIYKLSYRWSPVFNTGDVD
jgi:Lrp/AsnC family transcriptional regulator for asnA, asnC and gidA